MSDLLRIAGSWWPFRRTPKPVHACEVCSGDGVVRSGFWDHCPKGHAYVGVRAESEAHQ